MYEKSKGSSSWLGEANRREFIVGLGGAIGATSLAKGGSPARPFCIDCQSHLYCPELIKVMERRSTPPYAYRKDGQIYVVVGQWHRRLRPNHMDVEAKLADMDKAGIDVTVLSINDPGPELFGDEGPRVARLVNDFLADVSRAHPQRFVPVVFLPLQDMEFSLRELDRGVEKLGMKAVFLYSNIAGHFPDEPRFRPLFERVVRLDIPLFLHPAYPVTYEQTKGHQLTAGLGLMFDTTIALARLILAGVFEEFPNLKVVCPHLGGALPYLIGRLDHQTQVLKRGAEHIRRPPSEYLKQVWVDTVSPLPLAIRFAYEFFGPDKLLFGSDHPWVDPQVIGDCVRQAGLPPADYRKVMGENARSLLRL